VKNELLYISPAFETIWGRACASLNQSLLTWIDAIHPDDQQHVREAVMTKRTRGEYDEIYRIIRPDGSLRWIRDRAFPISNAAGEVYRVVGTAEEDHSAEVVRREVLLEEAPHESPRA
jgi:PAS domain S-box-containing protein